MMTYLQWFSYPYNKLLEPWMTSLIPFIMGCGLTAIIMDWVLPVSNRTKGRLTLIVLIVQILLYQNQFPPGRFRPDILLISLAGCLLCLYAIVFRKTLRIEWPENRYLSPYFIGLVVITIITFIKMIELESWPPFLNEYSANTGIWGLSATEGTWPGNPFQGRGFDLRGGGESPLMLPVMWLVMRQFGVSVWSVRCSEVIGSTILLIIFWSWLRRTIPGYWSVIALAVFGLSPWHLAQSRMGTFFSMSTAVAIGILWSANNLVRTKSTSGFIGWSATLGLFSGCIGWCYAPMKVLYPFFFIALTGIAIFHKHKPRRWWLGYIAALITFGVLLTSQFQGLQNPESMFQSRVGNLATDNPIWRKTVDDKVQNFTQPISVIATNITRNIVEWIRVTFQEPTILRFYPAALMMGVILAMMSLFLKWNPILTLYCLCGILPPLLIFPLHRRTLIIWPLVYMVAVLLLREISVAGAALFQKNIMRKLIPAIVLLCLSCMMLHGLHIWVSTWSIVKDHSYFGPARRLEAIQFATDVMDEHTVVFLNPWVHADIITITLYNRNKELGGNAYSLAQVSERNPGLHTFLSRTQPTVFIYFDLVNQPWLKDKLLSELPGGVLQEFRNSSGRRELLYSAYTVTTLL